MSEYEKKAKILRAFEDLIRQGKCEEEAVSLEQVEEAVRKLMEVTPDSREDFFETMDYLSKNIYALRINDFSVKAIFNMVEISPKMFISPVSNKLIYFLNGAYVSPKASKKIIESEPSVAMLSVAQIKIRMGVLEAQFKKGQVEEILYKTPKLLTMEPEYIKEALLQLGKDKKGMVVIDFETLLSLVSGRMYTQMQKLAGAIDYLVGEDMSSRAIDTANILAVIKTLLMERYPELEGVGVDEHFANVIEKTSFLEAQKRIFGDSFQLEPMQDEIVRRLGEQTGKGQL